MKKKMRLGSDNPHHFATPNNQLNSETNVDKGWQFGIN
jgi:hypothetical protein